ncbi:MAG: hypothetical protein HY926_05040 [Elusimicrobia bacterium]|nr:hypothetical protein [Elusimicrobiota bacterium]
MPMRAGKLTMPPRPALLGCLVWLLIPVEFLGGVWLVVWTAQRLGIDSNRVGVLIMIGFVAMAVGMAVVSMSASRMGRGGMKSPRALLAALGCVLLLPVIGVLAAVADVSLDPSPPRTETFFVVYKVKGCVGIHFPQAPWGHDLRPPIISPELLQSAGTGFPLRITWRAGALGLAWIQSVAAAERYPLVVPETAGPRPLPAVER